MAKTLSFNADVIVVGTGPGGATVCRELALAGKKVLIFERGLDHRKKLYYGTYLGSLLYTEKMGFLSTMEGINVVRPLMVGGATSIYSGSASDPPAWLKKKYRIDLNEYVDEIKKELGVAQLPYALRGRGSNRIVDSGRMLGMEWQPQPKFLNVSKSRKFSCSASCMLGCRCGAKWNAGEYIDQAVESGARLLTGALVEKVLFSGGRVKAIEGSMGMTKFTAHADTIILSAGGIGTARILRASGFKDAGKGMTMDLSTIVYGFINGRGNGADPPVSWTWQNHSHGYMLGTLTDPWMMYPFVSVKSGFRYLIKWPMWDKIIGVMIKLKDDISGGVLPDGKLRKALTEKDTAKLKKAAGVCEAVLIKAGADPEKIFIRPLSAMQPGGTVRIGTMLDRNLQTGINGLFVCDASIFPESLGQPGTLTIMGFAKKLARHILKGGK